MKNLSSIAFLLLAACDKPAPAVPPVAVTPPAATPSQDRPPAERAMAHEKEVGALQFSQDGSILVSWGDDYYIRAWETGTGKKKGEWRI